MIEICVGYIPSGMETDRGTGDAMPSPPGTTIRISIRVAFILQPALTLVTQCWPRTSTVIIIRLSSFYSRVPICEYQRLAWRTVGREEIKKGEGRTEGITCQSRDAVRMGGRLWLPLLWLLLLVDEKSWKPFSSKESSLQPL